MLDEKYLTNDHIYKIDNVTDRKKCGVWMNKVNASWNGNDRLSILKNITLSVTPGELLVVIGPVGSGKSSILMSVLPEIPVIRGEVIIRGQVAYAR